MLTRRHPLISPTARSSAAGGDGGEQGAEGTSPRRGTPQDPPLSILEQYVPRHQVQSLSCFQRNLANGPEERGRELVLTMAGTGEWGRGCHYDQLICPRDGSEYETAVQKCRSGACEICMPLWVNTRAPIMGAKMRAGHRAFVKAGITGYREAHLVASPPRNGLTQLGWIDLQVQGEQLAADVGMRDGVIVVHGLRGDNKRGWRQINPEYDREEIHLHIVGLVRNTAFPGYRSQGDRRSCKLVAIEQGQLDGSTRKGHWKDDPWIRAGWIWHWPIHHKLWGNVKPGAVRDVDSLFAYEMDHALIPKRGKAVRWFGIFRTEDLAMKAGIAVAKAHQIIKRSLHRYHFCIICDGRLVPKTIKTAWDVRDFMGSRKKPTAHQAKIVEVP